MVLNKPTKPQPHHSHNQQQRQEEHTLTHKHTGRLSGAVANVLDFNIVVSEFEPQLRLLCSFLD